MTSFNRISISRRKIFVILGIILLVSSVQAGEEDNGDVSKTGYFTNGKSGKGGDSKGGKKKSKDSKGDKKKDKGSKGGKGNDSKGDDDEKSKGGDKKGGGKGGACDLKLKGFATIGSGTTGGGNVKPKTVKSISQLRDAVKGNQAAVIIISGTITTGPNAVKIGNNKTLLGAKGAVIKGGLSVLTGGKNVIIRNLTVVGNGPGKKPEDAVNGRNVKNVWVDHCDLSDAGDGLLDMTKGSDLISVSYNRFWYRSTSHPHRLASLIGASSKDGNLDRGKLRVTFYGNHWSKNVKERMARVRFGHVHMVNNFYNSPENSYCVGVGTEAGILVENNHFENVKGPIHVQDKKDKANVVERGNLYVKTSGDKFKGPLHGGTAFTKPPYSFTPMAAKDVKSKVMACAGPVVASQLIK